MGVLVEYPEWQAIGEADATGFRVSEERPSRLLSRRQPIGHWGRTDGPRVGRCESKRKTTRQWTPLARPTTGIFSRRPISNLQRTIILPVGGRNLEALGAH